MTDATDRTRESEKYLRKDSPESLGDEMEIKDLLGIALILIGALFLKEAIQLLEPYLGVIVSATLFLVVGVIAVLAGGKLLLGK